MNTSTRSPAGHNFHKADTTSRAVTALSVILSKSYAILVTYTIASPELGSHAVCDVERNCKVPLSQPTPGFLKAEG